MGKLRVLGLAMFAYGAIMLVLLYSPWKDWALQHSIAEVVSTTDRRVGNRVDTADEPMALAGSAVVMFAGAWIGILVPYVMNRDRRRQMSAAGYDPDAPYDAKYEDPSNPADPMAP